MCLAINIEEKLCLGACLIKVDVIKQKGELQNRTGSWLPDVKVSGADSVDGVSGMCLVLNVTL